MVGNPVSTTRSVGSHGDARVYRSSGSTPPPEGSGSCCGDCRDGPNSGIDYIALFCVDEKIKRIQILDAELA